MIQSVYFSAMGTSTVKESYHLNTKPSKNNHARIEDNKLYCNNKIIDDLPDNKQKPFVLNDSTLIFMSDLNQGIRFYKLRTANIK